MKSKKDVNYLKLNIPFVVVTALIALIGLAINALGIATCAMEPTISVSAIILRCFSCLLFLTIIYYISYGYRIKSFNFFKHFLFLYGLIYGILGIINIIYLSNDIGKDHLSLASCALLVGYCVILAYLGGRVHKIKSFTLISILLFLVVSSFTAINAYKGITLCNYGTDLGSISVYLCVFSPLLVFTALFTSHIATRGYNAGILIDL